MADALGASIVAKLDELRPSDKMEIIGFRVKFNNCIPTFVKYFPESRILRRR